MLDIDEILKFIILNSKSLQFNELVEDVYLYTTYSSSETRLLHYAAINGNTKLAKSVIGCGFEIVPMNKSKETPLMICAKLENLKMVKILLNATADFRCRYIRGKNTLTMAFELKPVRDGQAFIKRFFTETIFASKHVDDIAKVLVHERSSLVQAVYLNNPKVISRMIACIAEFYGIRLKDLYNATLVAAALINNRPLITMMLQLGADRSRKNHYGRIPFEHVLIYQFGYQEPDLMKVLMPENFNWTEIREYGILELYHVFTRGSKDTLDIFMDRYYIDMRKRDIRGQTPLHYLVRNTNQGTTYPFLFEDEFDLNARDYMNATALHCAASLGNLEWVYFLLCRDADVNVRNSSHHTPLICTFESPYLPPLTQEFDEEIPERFEAIVQQLLIHGADIEFESTRGPSSVLIYAKRFKMIKPVLAHLALLEVTKKSHKYRELIRSNQQLESYYQMCREQLEQSRTDCFTKGLTTYALLTESAERLVSYMKKSFFVGELIHYYESTMESYYMSLILNRMVSAHTKI